MIARSLLGMLLRAVLTVFVVASLAFFLLPLVPGDPVDAVLGQSAASAEVRARVAADLGLDQPLAVQYVTYIANLFTLNFGRSWVFSQSVNVLLAQNVAATASLASVSFVGAFGLGLALTVAAQHPVLNPFATGLTVIALSTPVLVSGLGLIWLFAISLNVLPASGQGGLAFIVLPACALALPTGGVIGRVLQTEFMTDTVQRASVRSRARGVGVFRRYALHMFPLAWSGASEVIGLQAAFLFGGTIVTETLFTRSGLGRLLVTAVLNKDIPVVQGVVVTIAILYVILLQLVALSRILLDPRLT